MQSPFECLCGNFILPEPASYVFFYALFNLRKLLYIIEGADHTPAQAGGQLGEKVPPHLVLLNGLQKGAQLFPIQNLLWEVIGL